ncbi:hypothetical protein [Nostoc sp. 'Lobaria pulmonaria (5183) cyanobiont']|uniref:hypothetical protein n=1 Tax=Nostoc sp. 'Lobaria pulmonaria (5183) cyanobiont' TaxID=1618022 RepID=UPI000CF316E5|nr:hypothetical protein [Nostoc sp. 'Lobaria pulmonaria (5183) cyanobiont']AVH73828.1 hypothetical protein NLP_5530 [Nostoc sp. 'Lobaria pulmonaria (5183) cyanobiont']
MTQNLFKNNLSWTEAHDAYCYQHHIPPAAKILWQWLIRQGQIASEIEPDLSEFNAWVAKVRGKPYAHNYLKKIFDILVSCRVLQVIKQYSWKITKLLVRPITWLNPPKKVREKKLYNQNSSYDLDPSNKISVDEEVCSSSNNLTPTTAEFIELERQHEILSVCAEYQIYFDPNKRTTRHLLEFDIEDVRKALKHFIFRGGHQEIRDPQGWLISCLRECYWADNLLDSSGFIELLKSWFPSNLPRDY